MFKRNTSVFVRSIYSIARLLPACSLYNNQIGDINDQRYNIHILTSYY